jgi:hypothetical protein
VNAILCNTRQLVKRNPLAVGDSQTPVIPCNAPIITRNGMRLPGNSGTLRRYVSLHSVGGTPGRSVVAVSVALEGSGGGVTSECLEKTHKLPWAVVHERVGIRRSCLPSPSGTPTTYMVWQRQRFIPSRSRRLFTRVVRGRGVLRSSPVTNSRKWNLHSRPYLCSDVDLVSLRGQRPVKKA